MNSHEEGHKLVWEEIALSHYEMLVKQCDAEHPGESIILHTKKQKAICKQMYEHGEWRYFKRRDSK